MATSVLHELLPAFKERNNVLSLLLGLMSLSDRWVRLLESEAAAAHRVASEPQALEPVEPDLGLMYFLLGTISFSNNFHALIQATPPPSEALPGESTSPAAWSDPRGLLR
jgi:hypothetical protein